MTQKATTVHSTASGREALDMSLAQLLFSLQVGVETFCIEAAQMPQRRGRTGQDHTDSRFFTALLICAAQTPVHDFPII